MKTKLFSAFLLSSVFSLTYSISAFAENNQVDLTDVSSEHWAYQALEKLIVKYDLKLGYPDKTFQGNKNITRYEVAALLAQVLDKLEGRKVIKEDIKIIKDISHDYGKDIDKITDKLDSIEDQLDMLQTDSEKQQFNFKNFMDSMPFIISGDIGFRYQLNTQQLGQDFTNQVAQTRISLGLESRQINPIGYGIKIISGGSNRATNTWWKFSDFFAQVPLNFDRFFVTYRPANFFEFTIGRFKDPFSNTEIYLDEEISPQGALQTFKFSDMSDVFKELSFTAGEIVVNMDKDLGNTYSLNGAAELKMNFTDFIGVDLKGGYYHYINAGNIAKANIAPATNTTGKTFEPRIIGNTNSNTLDSSGNYAANFNILNGFGKIIFRLSDRFPLSFSGDYLYNLGTNQNNQAFQASARIGNTKEPGCFFLGYNYKYLQADSTISLFVEDQLGSTDVSAHEGVFGIKLFDSTVLSATLQAKNGIKTPGNTNYTMRVNLIQGF